MVCEVFVFRYYEIFNEESLGIAVRTLGVAQRAVRHETAERAVAGADDMLPGKMCIRDRTNPTNNTLLPILLRKKHIH